METPLTFRIYGNPKPQGSKKHIGNGRMIEANPGHHHWRLICQTTLTKEYQQKPLEQPIHITATFYLPKPKKPRYPTPATGYDLDKLCRALGDALEKANIITNDARIIHWHATKTYANQQNPPGVHVTITPQES